MASPVMVKFIRDSGAYGAGDMAGFDTSSAKSYVEKGLAEYLTTEVAESPAQKEQATSDEESEGEEPAKKKRSSRLKKRRGE